MSSKIDIYLPTYKPDELYLLAALESLRDQTEQDWRLYINDQPTDVDTKSFIRPYLEDERISFFVNDRKPGIGGNWNDCLQHGEAPYVQYIFQDDLWDPTFLERGIKVLDENESVGLVSLDHRYKYEGGMTNHALYDEVNAVKRSNFDHGIHNGQKVLRWWIDQELRPNIIGEPSFVMLRRSVMEQVGPFNETMPQFLDSEYWMRCLKRTNWYYIKDELGNFRVHPDAASAVNEESGAGALDRFECFGILIESLDNGELKKEATKARNRAFSNMVKKYFTKKKAGKSINIRGGNTSVLKRFALKHPISFIQSLLKGIF